MNRTAVKKYVDAARIQILSVWARPIETIGYFLSLPFVMVINYSIWGIFFSTHETIGGFTFANMLAYLFLTFCFRKMSGPNETNDIEEEIKSGSIITYLARPIDYFMFRLSARVGTILITTPIIILITLGTFIFLGKEIPPLTHFAVAFVLSFIGLIALFELFYCINLLAFWFEEVWGFRRGAYTTAWLFSGSLIPISLLPGFLHTIGKILPFSHQAATPTLYLLGLEPFSTVQESFLILLAWIIGLYFAQRIIWKKGLRTYDGKG